MSQDYKIQNKCDHLINWEAEVLQSDRRTLYLSYPLGARDSLSIRMNNIVLNKISFYSVTTLPNVATGIFSKTFIRFNNPTKLYNPLIEAKYTTLSTYCPKCAGVNYLDDIIYGPDKDVVMAQDEVLLIQTLEKFIVTEVNSNPYHTWVGTSIGDLVGTKITDISYLKTNIYNNVKKAVDNLKTVQAQYSKSGRVTTLGELFGDLIAIDVTQSTADPSTILVTVKFSAQSGRVLLFEQLVEANLNQLLPA